MRTFDDIEKFIINQILDRQGFSRNLINIFNETNKLSGVRIVVDKTSNKADFIFQLSTQNPTQTEIDQATKEQAKITEQLIQHLVLLKYLEKEELAIFFDSVTLANQIIEFGAGVVGAPGFSMAINDSTLVGLLIKYAHKEICPTPLLKSLRNNKFIFPDEIRFKHQQIAAWSAIAVSLSIGIFGIYSGWQSSKAQAQQIKECEAISSELANQLDSLAKSNDAQSASLSKISESLESMKNQVALMPKNQTIEIKMVKDNGK